MNADEQKNHEQPNSADEQPTLVIPPAHAAPVAPPAPYASAAPSAPSEPYVPPLERTRLPARASTIVWGVLLLGFCAWTGVIALGGSIPNPITWLTTALIVGGIALVLAGIATAARKR
jgi:hypothetical protein